MHFVHIVDTIMVILLAAALMDHTLGMPLPQSVEARAGSQTNCPGGNGPPCVCSTGLGLRLGDPNCGPSALTFRNPPNPADATLALLPAKAVKAPAKAKTAAKKSKPAPKE
ncbi:hypothetical protein HMN09_00778300 [Mycena chlorophos]|uniref:Secreted protein n=1 Tax=Mycena chlorophos TaxID=658473 RepID=A0A8H6SU28_MYCCL|nr:hypothetical protein HMN09_00778300 [Mycena chlorophos]